MIDGDRLYEAGEGAQHDAGVVRKRLHGAAVASVGHAVGEVLNAHQNALRFPNHDPGIAAAVVYQPRVALLRHGA